MYYKKNNKLKLNQIFYKGSNNIKSNLFFNFKKFKKSKWKKQRGLYKKNKFFGVKRYNIMNEYNFYNSSKTVNFYSYKLKKSLLKKLKIYFFIKSDKIFKKIFYRSKYKQTLHTFKTINCRLDFFLYHMGLFSDIKSINKFIKEKNILVNKKKVPKNKNIFLNDLDSITINFKRSNCEFGESGYSRILKKNLNCKHYKMSYYYILFKRLKKRIILNIVYPMFFSINYKSFSFIFFKNKTIPLWTYYINFYEVLKFLKYGR